MTFREPATGPAAWTGDEQSRRDDWVIHLRRDQLAEIAETAKAVRSRGMTLQDADAFDDDLPSLAPALRTIRDELATGRGFVLLRGLNVDAHTPEEMGLIFWGIGTCLGIGVAQSAGGDRLGHVINRGARDRYYTAGGPIEFHMDPVDVVALLCLRPALRGGASRIASSRAIHNVIRDERPDLLEVLYNGFHCSRKGHGDAVTEWRVPVFARGDSGLESYFLPITIRQAEEEGVPLGRKEREALNFIQEVASRRDIRLDMDFRPGDIQFLNNRVIFHARTDYEDSPDPAKRRHLLRLWLMMPDWPPRVESMDLHRHTDRAGGGVRSDGNFRPARHPRS